MMKPFLAALLLVLGLAPEARAWITIQDLGTPECAVQPLPSPNPVKTAGRYFLIPGGNKQTDFGFLTDPFAPFPALAGHSPYIGLIDDGSSSDHALASVKFSEPQTSISVVLGTLDAGENSIRFLQGHGRNGPPPSTIAIIPANKILKTLGLDNHTGAYVRIAFTGATFNLVNFVSTGIFEIGDLNAVCGP
jgi:hypothetical protein